VEYAQLRHLKNSKSRLLRPRTVRDRERAKPRRTGKAESTDAALFKDKIPELRAVREEVAEEVIVGIEGSTSEVEAG